ncbi:MAG: hypothetical protein ACI4V4_00345 [Eubacterium sp.]
MDRFKFKIYPRELLFSFFLIMLPASLLLEMNFNISIAAYTDEILCIICILYLLYLSFKKGIKGNDLTFIIILMLCTVWGLIGNAFSKLITNWFPIIVDVLCLFKMFATYLIYKEVARYDKKHKIIDYITNIAKFFIISGAACGTISLFVDIGMSGERRYGIPSFNFIFPNNGSRFAYVVACCLLIVLISEKRPKKVKIYEFLSILSMIYTTKGVVYIVVACYIVLTLMWRKRDKFTPQNVFFLSIAGIIVSNFQIQTYLKDETSPRMTLIKYGFVTANKYFPFGSGFATYGSDMAARYYSKLYEQYGFNNMYGMSQSEGLFLNDCYMGMVFGQFGYIGTLLFSILIIIMFKSINKINLGKKVKALAISIFIGLIISSIGTAIIKSSIGVFVFAILGIVCGYSKRNEIISEQKQDEIYI